MNGCLHLSTHISFGLQKRSNVESEWVWLLILPLIYYPSFVTA